MQGLKISNLQIGYDIGRSQKPAMTDFSCVVAGGSISYLVGRNGSGKSTLLGAIGGNLRYEGSISWNGNELGGNTHNVSIFPQDIDSVTPYEITVRELFRAFKVGENELNQILKREIFDLLRRERNFLDRQLGEFSGGQRQLLLWAAAIGLRGEILLLDETMRAMDPWLRDLLWQDLERVVIQREAAAIVVTHDFHFILDNPKDVVVVEDGRFVCCLEADQLTLERIKNSVSE